MQGSMPDRDAVEIIMRSSITSLPAVSECGSNDESGLAEGDHDFENVESQQDALQPFQTAAVQESTPQISTDFHRLDKSDSEVGRRWN